MPWYRTKEGSYRHANPGGSAEALYDQRGYENLGEDTPPDLLSAVPDEDKLESSWAPAKWGEPKKRGKMKAAPDGVRDET